LSWSGDETANAVDDTARLWSSGGDHLAVVWDQGPVASIRELTGGALLMESRYRGYQIRTPDGPEFGWLSVEGMLPLERQRFLCWKTDALQIIEVDIEGNSFRIERQWRVAGIQTCLPPRPPFPWWTVIAADEDRALYLFRLYLLADATVPATS
jgi:hypothetical protein